MTTTKIETCTDEEIAEVAGLVATVTDPNARMSASRTAVDRLVVLAARMAPHLAALKVEGRTVCEQVDNLGAAVFIDRDLLAHLCQAEAICYDCDEPAVDGAACVEHGGEAQS